MEGMEACVVCAALNNPESSRDLWIHEDDLVLLAHVPPSNATAIDAYPGHLLLVPRRHVERPGAVTDDEAQRIGLWIARASRMLESALGAEHVYIARLGDGWAHLHVHIIPRYAGTPERYRGLNVRDWPGVARCDRAKSAAIAEQLRQAWASLSAERPLV